MGKRNCDKAGSRKDTYQYSRDDTCIFPLYGNFHETVIVTNENSCKLAAIFERVAGNAVDSDCSVIVCIRQDNGAQAVIALYIALGGATKLVLT
jgi:hypothetical protein